MNMMASFPRSNIGVAPRQETLPPNFRLPLVSVIVVNYNYGRYLGQAVDSVYAQTYPSIECIVVDNASTDETPSVLALLASRYSELIVITRDANDGQTTASLDGLRRSAGHYIIFLDADDVLMPTCIETHICVHLSSRIHVGFTACDMMQATGDGDVVVGTGEAMSGYLRGWRGRGKSISRPCLAEGDWPTAGIAEKVSAKIRYVPPSWTRWVWSPTSGLCFRRDAISLFADNANLRDLRAGTDAYFAHGVGAWCGSILIDEPLFIYRIHHTNVFSRSIQLNNVLNFDPRGPSDYNAKAKLALTGQFIRYCARFSRGQILRKVQLAALLFRFNGTDEDPSRPHWARRSHVARHLVEHRDLITAEFGKPATYLLMLAFGVPLPVIWRCWQPSA